MSKTISFISPCFNDGDTIEKLVRSLRDQDLPDIEIIVVNDGSTDNSKIILDSLKEQGLVDAVIHFEQNRGACIARNEGAKIAKGIYFSFLPADAILYPGMARIWYTQLEENKDYDFLYGGYRFVDEDGDPLANSDYFSQSFEPYLLEVTNYIDGSFPIRATSYWKYAEIMGQKDGLWDANIKSLQDWDFWLSVVLHGGKGLYAQEIFFGTTPPHEGGLSYDSSRNWLERTEAIKKKHNIPLRKLCVASLGAGFHAKRIAHMLDADFKEMPSFKPHRYDAVYVIGFYPEFAPQQDAMFFNNVGNPNLGRTAAKKIVHFIGTDIFQLQNVSMRLLKNIWQPYFKTQVDVRLCESETTQAELAELGIEAQVVPIPPLKLYEPQPLPKDFTVACYMPMVNAEFYRPQEMIEIAKKLPDVKFKFFGNPIKRGGSDPAIADNIDFVGYVDDMESFIKDCTAIMRFPIHDGLPISVVEFILAGRYSVQSFPLQYSITMPDFNVDAAVEAIKKIRDIAKEPNMEGAQYWRNIMDHDKFKNAIHKHAGYFPKEYWENRARAWSDQAAAMPIEVEEVKKIFEKTGAKSVMDIGCGDGRWYSHLKEWGIEEYFGTDISENLIKAAQVRFPAIKDNFAPLSVEQLGDSFEASGKKKFDLVFSYTCLEHIKEEDFPKAIESLKKIADKFLIIEPPGEKNQDMISRYYCHRNDYEKYFTVLEKVLLPDKTIYLCQ